MSYKNININPINKYKHKMYVQKTFFKYNDSF